MTNKFNKKNYNQSSAMQIMYLHALDCNTELIEKETI